MNEENTKKNLPLKRFALEWANRDVKKRNAMANAIMGAILYATNIIERGELHPESWNEVDHRGILYVNGYRGTEYVSGIRRRKIIKHFYAWDGELVNCLGSTAENTKGIKPQVEAITFLRRMEDVGADRFSPIALNPNDAKLLVNIFCANFGAEKPFNVLS